MGSEPPRPPGQLAAPTPVTTDLGFLSAAWMSGGHWPRRARAVLTADSTWKCGGAIWRGTLSVSPPAERQGQDQASGLEVAV